MPSPSRIAVSDAPNGVEGCNDEDYEESIANIPHLQRRVIIAVVGIRHVPDKARSFDDAGRVASYEPKGMVSPSQQRPLCDLITREIPYNCTTREGRIAVQDVLYAIQIKA